MFSGNERPLPSCDSDTAYELVDTAIWGLRRLQRELARDPDDPLRCELLDELGELSRRIASDVGALIDRADRQFADRYQAAIHDRAERLRAAKAERQAQRRQYDPAPGGQANDNAEAEQARLEAVIAATKETARQEATARAIKDAEQRARLAGEAAERRAERDRRKEAELQQLRSRLKSAAKP